MTGSNEVRVTLDDGRKKVARVTNPDGLGRFTIVPSQVRAEGPREAEESSYFNRDDVPSPPRSRALLVILCLASSVAVVGMIFYTLVTLGKIGVKFI